VVNRVIVALTSVVFVCVLCADVTVAADQPETVMVTFRAKPGAEAELARVIASHWRTASELNLVTAAPHLTLRAAEDGHKTYFVEVFTWRDASIPDAAPAAIKKIWSQMNALVESRGGHPGLHFEEVSIVD
jgi:hypothetical protein